MSVNYPIIPKPSDVVSIPGHFSMDKDIQVYYHEDCKEIVELLIDLLENAIGIEIPSKIYNEDENPQGIILDLKPKLKNIGKEGYNILITPRRIHVKARTKRGIFYSVQTMRQLLPSWAEDKELKRRVDLQLPCIEITDNPEFEWRGFMLDTARHFYSKDVVIKMLDVMALLKLNVFHWSLTNDQGWRVQIDKYPKLVEIGSKRRESQINGYLSRKKNGTPHEGYYTKEDIAEVIEHANKLFIKVIPEINMPGHCKAALAAYPEYSCTGGPFEVSTTFGIKKDVFCVGKESTFTFLQDILDEIIDMFPSDIIHIGGDEVPRKRWKVCEDCQKRIEKEGLESTDKLQTYFTNRMAEYIISKGRTPMGWNEILDRDLNKSVNVQFWTRWKGNLKEHLKKGGKSVMSPYTKVYLDYSYGVRPLKTVYNYSPKTRGLDDVAKNNILGIEAPMWTEFSPTAEHMQKFVFPRLAAHADNAWASDIQRDYKAFVRRLPAFFKRLDILGVAYTSIKASQPGLIRRIIKLVKFFKQASELPYEGEKKLWWDLF
ncbi:MAG: beta-N-acetylhexosaminidase [Candidatus Hodarchaeota archaeon]